MKLPFFFAFCVVLLALACGPSQQAGIPSRSDQPRAGGRLNAYVSADPTSFDVVLSGVSSVSDRWRAKAYEGVLGFKNGPDIEYGTLIVEPKLAERWEVSPDAKTYTFYLRKGVKWQNIPPVNGRDFTAADVKFSWEYGSRTGEFKDKKDLKPARFRWWFEGLETIETPDKYTVVAKFKEPFAPFINYTSHTKNAMYAREVFDKEGHFEDTLIGTGPFMLDPGASQKGSRWVLKKHPDYWQAGRPYIDEFWGLVLPEKATAVAALQTRQIDLISKGGDDLFFEDMKQITSKVPDAVIYKEYSPSPQNMYLNVRRPPFDNALVRRALHRAMDRAEFVKVLTNGEGNWAIAGAFPDSFTQDEIKTLSPYDPEEAKRLLAQAGYPNGLDLEFLVSTAYGQSYVTMAELLQAQLRKVGIRMTIRSLDHPAYLAQTRGNTFDFAIRGKSMMGDVDSYLYAVFHPSSESNYGGVNDPELTPLLEQQRREANPEKRREAIRQAIKMISDKALGLALFYEVEYHAWQPYLKNYAPHWGTDGWPLTNVWLDK